MARSRKNLKRDRQFNVGLTQREHELLLARAAASGMRPVDYCRGRLFGSEPVRARFAPSAPHLDPLFIAQLSRLGNNLNQLARQLNTQPQQAPPELRPLLERIRQLIAQGVPG